MQAILQSTAILLKKLKKIQVIYAVISIVLSTLFSGILLPSSVSADSVTIQPNASDAKDAYVSGASQGTNYGDYYVMQVGNLLGPGQPQTGIALLQFPLTSIPTNATINSATLTLKLEEQNSASTIRLERVTSTWTESSVNYTSRPSVDSTSDYRVELVNPATFDVSFTVTNLVQDWVNGTVQNYGVQLSILDTSTTANYRFFSSDDETTSNWPKLTVNYTPGNNSPSISSLGPTSLVNGSSSTDTTPGAFTFTTADADSGNTVKFQIQIDDSSNFSSPVIDYTSALETPGSKSFTAGQSAGSGSYSTGNADTVLGVGNYYWRVRAIDNNDAESSWSTANSGGIAFKVIETVDSTPTPTPTPTSTATAAATSTSTPTATTTATPTTTTAPTATPTPTVTQVESCTRNIRDVTVAANHDKATITFTTPTATKGTVYFYTDSRTSPAGDSTKRASGYTQNSTKIEEATSTKNHSLELTGLQPLATYYYTILSGTSVQDCEHSFTTQETPPTPTPTPVSSVLPSPTLSPSAAPTLNVSPNIEASVWSKIAGFITGNEPLGPSGIGAIASAAVTTLALGTPTFELLVRLTTNIQNLPNQLNVFAWKRRKQTWGRVVSSLTLEGIPQAQVILYDLGNYRRVVDRYLTDKEGRFGFLVKPGTYGMSVARAGYTFPSVIRKDGYHSEEFKVGEDGVVQVDIPLDPAQLHRPWRQQLEYALVRLEIIRRPLLALGTAFTLFNILSAITLLNLFFLVYYARLWYAEFHRSKESRHILTLKGENGNALAFAIVRLKNKEGKVILTKATDVNGRVFLLVERGSYTLEVTPPAGSNTERGFTKDIFLPSGILAKPLVVDINQPAFA